MAVLTLSDIDTKSEKTKVNKYQSPCYFFYERVAIIIGTPQFIEVLIFPHPSLSFVKIPTNYYILNERAMKPVRRLVKGNKDAIVCDQ